MLSFFFYYPKMIKFQELANSYIIQTDSIENAQTVNKLC